MDRCGDRPHGLALDLVVQQLPDGRPGLLADVHAHLRRAVERDAVAEVRQLGAARLLRRRRLHLEEHGERV